MRYLFIYYNNPMATNFIFVPQGSMTPIAKFIWNFLKITLACYNIWSRVLPRKTVIMPRATGTQTFRNTRVEMIEYKDICPYNRSHLIRPERMQRHLILCRKDVLSKPSHPFYVETLEHEKCPFDANHHIPKIELSNHDKSCPSRRQVQASHNSLNYLPCI